MAGAHMVAEDDTHIDAAHTMQDESEHCCANATCHVLAAVLPSSILSILAKESVVSVVALHGTLPTGIQPDGPFDPPQSA